MSVTSDAPQTQAQSLLGVDPTPYPCFSRGLLVLRCLPGNPPPSHRGLHARAPHCRTEAIGGRSSLDAWQAVLGDKRAETVTLQ